MPEADPSPKHTTDPEPSAESATTQLDAIRANEGQPDAAEPATRQSPPSAGDAVPQTPAPPDEQAPAKLTVSAVADFILHIGSDLLAARRSGQLYLEKRRQQKALSAVETKVAAACAELGAREENSDVLPQAYERTHLASCRAEAQAAATELEARERDLAAATKTLTEEQQRFESALQELDAQYGPLADALKTQEEALAHLRDQHLSASQPPTSQSSSAIPTPESADVPSDQSPSPPSPELTVLEERVHAARKAVDAKLLDIHRVRGEWQELHRSLKRRIADARKARGEANERVRSRTRALVEAQSQLGRMLFGAGYLQDDDPARATIGGLLTEKEAIQTRREEVAAGIRERRDATARAAAVLVVLVFLVVLAVVTTIASLRAVRDADAPITTAQDTGQAADAEGKAGQDKDSAAPQGPSDVLDLLDKEVRLVE